MTDTERAIRMLNDLLQRKMNSPATYLLQASPYATESDGPILEEIEALHRTDRQDAVEAAHLIMSLEGAPFAGSYEPDIADTNYLSVQYLLGQLLARLEQDVATVEQYARRCEIPEAKAFFRRVLEQDSTHRDRLKQLLQEAEAQRPDLRTHQP